MEIFQIDQHNDWTGLPDMASLGLLFSRRNQGIRDVTPLPEGRDLGNDYDLNWLVGRSLTEVERFEHGSWRFEFGLGMEVRADCPWRVVFEGGIALSSEDHGRQYGLPAPVNAESECRRLIGGGVVAAAEVREETRDIVIRFASGPRLEVLPLSSGYESWQVIGPGGNFVVAQGGGQLAIWSAPEANPFS